jgi:hypothetical protein
MWTRGLSSHQSTPRFSGRLDFENQVRKAIFVDSWRWLARQRRDLVRFDDVVGWRSRHFRRLPELMTVSIDLIVGSVGRATDFTRDFLPRRCVSGARWSSIDYATQQGIGLPPVELFGVGDVYFVMDGHHRTSVARASGVLFIDAVVTALESPVWLTAEDFDNDGWMKKVFQPESVDYE